MITEQITEPERVLVSSQVPANVREYASKHRVGTPLALYRSRHLLFSIVRSGVETIGLVVATAYCLKVYIDSVILDRAYPLPTSNPIEQAFQSTLQALLWLILIFAIAAILCAISFWHSYRAYQQKLYLCQDGLLRLGRKKEEAIRWDEVIDMFGGSTGFFVLHREGGGRFVICESWSYNKELNERIAHILTERLLPQVIERFEKGVPISFGTLFISRDGIRHERKVTPWSDIEDVRDKNGVLIIRAKGKGQVYMLIDTSLIVALVKHVMRSRLVAVLRNHVMQLQATLPEAAE